MLNMISLRVAEVYRSVWVFQVGTKEDVNQIYDRAWNIARSSFGVISPFCVEVEKEYLKWITESGQLIPPHLKAPSPLPNAPNM